MDVFETEALDAEERLAEMKRLLTEELPADNYFVLKYVVHFLTEVAYHCRIHFQLFPVVHAVDQKICQNFYVFF